MRDTLACPEASLRAEVAIKDVYDVLRQKEVDLARVCKEIKALRIVIPLLADLIEHLNPLTRQTGGLYRLTWRHRHQADFGFSLCTGFLGKAFLWLRE